MFRHDSEPWNGHQYNYGTAGTGGLLTALRTSRFIGKRIGEHVLRFDLELRQKSQKIKARLRITTADLDRFERLERSEAVERLERLERASVLLERLEQVHSCAALS